MGVAGHCKPIYEPTLSANRVTSCDTGCERWIELNAARSAAESEVQVVSRWYRPRPPGALLVCHRPKRELRMKTCRLSPSMPRVATIAAVDFFPECCLAGMHLNPRTHMLFPPILERTWGAIPHAISPLIEIEMCDRDHTNPWDVLRPMVPELPSLGHILTPAGRVKVKKIAI